MLTFRFPAELFSDLRNRLLDEAPREAAAFLLAGTFATARGLTFVVREAMFLGPGDYDRKEDLSLQVSAIFVNRVISKAERMGLTVVVCHTHPFGEHRPDYSAVDDAGERITAKTIGDCLGGRPVGSLLVGPGGVRGRVWKTDSGPPVMSYTDEIRLVGGHLELIAEADDEQSSFGPGDFSRQILALGEEAQRTVGRLRIGLVGVGGIGSAVAEQLARLGVTHFVLVDPDRYEESNLTRVYGSEDRDRVKKPAKVTITARLIKRIRPRAVISRLEASVIRQDVLRELMECDIIFSSTDRHGPRAVLNELAYQYLIPVLDMGVGLQTTEAGLEGTVRLTRLLPNEPCLFCQELIRPDIIAAEQMPPPERQRLAQEGYIQGIDSPAPSVVPFTTMAAALGAAAFLDLLTGSLQSPHPTTLLDVSTLSTRRLKAAVKEECVCRRRLAMGDSIPLSAPGQQLSLRRNDLSPKPLTDWAGASFPRGDE